MAILVTGGAGYIGSHTVLYLQEKGEEVIVLDDFSTGHKSALFDVPVYEGSIHHTDLLDKVFQENRIDSVIHFAASSLVGESVENPLKYYKNNVIGTYHLINKMIEHNVKNIVFSSTAAVYGEPRKVPIKENDLANPANPYGETKLAIENMMKWAGKAYGLKYVSLRYFNASGADPNGRIGENHRPETHLIPIVLQVALKQREKILIYGDDYDTKDGSCIRDYVHVMDLAEAHYLSVLKLRRTNTSGIYNLGNGEGFSVYEVIETCRAVTGEKIRADVTERREGDPAVLIASPEKAERELGWNPKYGLESMIEHAWSWHYQYHNGYQY